MFAIASELLQSVGSELALFLVTVALAISFRGLPVKKSGSLTKKANASSPKQAQFRQRDSAGQRQDVRKPANQTFGSCGSISGLQSMELEPRLVRKIHAMMDHADKRQAAEALAIYQELKVSDQCEAIKDAAQLRKQHPAAVFGALVQSAVRVGQPDVAEALVDDMAQFGIERSLVFYESVMKVLASKKYYKEALAVCSRLEADGLEPSPVTLSCLVNFAVEIGEADRAISFFERLSSSGSPSIRAYMTVLRVHSGRQDWPRSVALLREMQQKQVQIDGLVVNIVLATGVAAGELAAAETVLDEFSQKEIADVVSFNTVMKGLAQKKDFDRAKELLAKMSKTALRPNAITFNTVMDAAVRSAQMTDAWGVLVQMVDAGLAPDKFTCTTLMKGLQGGATADQLMIILDLLRNVKAHSDSHLCSSLFHHVIDLTTRLNDASLTKRVVEQMREQRVMMPAHDYNRLLQLLLRNDHQAKRCAAPWRHATREAAPAVRVH